MKNKTTPSDSLTYFGLIKLFHERSGYSMTLFDDHSHRRDHWSGVRVIMVGSGRGGGGEINDVSGG